jgi:hypothetical protein
VILGAVTARVAQFGQFDGIALPAKDGLYDLHSCDSRDVADHMGKL